MPSSFGKWLEQVLGWVASRRRNTAGPATPTVEGEPAAQSDEVPPAALTEEPAQAEQEAPPAAATPAPSAEVTAGEPARTVDAEPVAEAAPVAADEEPAAGPATVVADAEPGAAEPAVTTGAEAEPAGGSTEPVAPAVVPAPRPAADDAVKAGAAGGEGAADDFRRIQGIGPKMATALQAAGIRTYQQLAELDEAALRETLKAAGVRPAPSLATWPQQAKLLAGARAEAEQVLPAGTGGN
ncbi:helix-hairpin-helix domain-containing protein, partial [Micromonospora yasonensis]|uniref:helix-hairpin-helix domain-containing protein n=1 Tax=Micromonospora yasonensis TaxID=1128667 RepID=UPI0029F47A94